MVLITLLALLYPYPKGIPFTKPAGASEYYPGVLVVPVDIAWDVTLDMKASCLVFLMISASISQDSQVFISGKTRLKFAGDTFHAEAYNDYIQRL